MELVHVHNASHIPFSIPCPSPPSQLPHLLTPLVSYSHRCSSLFIPTKGTWVMHMHIMASSCYLWSCWGMWHGCGSLWPRTDRLFYKVAYWCRRNATPNPLKVRCAEFVVYNTEKWSCQPKGEVRRVSLKRRRKQLLDFQEGPHWIDTEVPFIEQSHNGNAMGLVCGSNYNQPKILQV